MSFKDWQRQNNPIAHKISNKPKRIPATSRFFVGDIVDYHDESHRNGIVVSRDDARTVWDETVTRDMFGSDTLWVLWPGESLPLQGDQRHHTLVSHRT